jgi:NADH:ubiquinone oxidoreductase subunit 4 (subunit M)
MNMERLFTSKVVEDSKYLDSKSFSALSPKMKMAVQDTFNLIETQTGNIIKVFENSVEKVAEHSKINKEELYKYFDKTTHKMQFVENYPWITTWNINYKVGIDGISVLFIILVTILSILCVTVSWRVVQHRLKEFFVSLLVLETAMIGIFISLNAFLFYLFWELTLIPMFLLIGVWGGQKRIYSAVKFVLFMLAGSVFMLVGIIILYHVGGKTFDILELLGRDTSLRRIETALEKLPE